MYATTPAAAAHQRNNRFDGTSRLRQYRNANHAARRNSAVASITMMSNAQCTSVTLEGWLSFGMSFSPVTYVDVLPPARNESRPGILMPPLTVFVDES